MKIKSLIFIIITSFILAIFIGCDDTSSENSFYKFRIDSSGNGFYGKYTVDSETTQFEVTSKDSDDVYYSLEVNLTRPSTIYITAEGCDNPTTGDGCDSGAGSVDTQSITIEVYENESRVNNAYGSKVTDEHLIVVCDHDFTADDSVEEE